MKVTYMGKTAVSKILLISLPPSEKKTVKYNRKKVKQWKEYTKYIYIF